MEIPGGNVETANIILAGKYQLKEVVGQGSFGQIFKAIVKGSEAVVAIKVEKKTNHSFMTLTRESKTLSELNGCVGFPNLYAYGKEDKYNFMVISLLGLNLEKLLKISGRLFSMKTVLMLADQMLTRIETLHGKNYIHRDIKPENFVMGSGSTSKNLFLIDFGLARRYQNNDGVHIEYKESKGLIGTARYASINAHMGTEQSRRDDLEAIGYTLVYFAKGKLPWQNITASNKHEKYLKIANLKMKTPPEELCKGLPKAFESYMNYVKELGFTEEPNYKYLKKLFRKLFLESGCDFDYAYDWHRGSNSDPVHASRISVAKNNLRGGDPLFSIPIRHAKVDDSSKKNSNQVPPGMSVTTKTLRFKAKEMNGMEEVKDDEFDEENLKTEMLSKGVNIEGCRRVLADRYQRSLSSKHTSKAMHISGLRAVGGHQHGKPIDSDEQVIDSPSQKFEEFMSIARLKSLEYADEIEARERGRSREPINKNSKPLRQLSQSHSRQSIFGRMLSMNVVFNERTPQGKQTPPLNRFAIGNAN